MIGDDFLDSIRAKQIMKSPEPVQVLYQDIPVWIDNVWDNNIAEVTRMDSRTKIEVPVYMLVENSPANK